MQAASAVVMGLILAGDAGAQVRTPPSFTTGASLRERLAAPVGVSWSGRGLREALESLGRNFQVCVLLDRRVDPQTPVEWSATDLPLADVIAQLAERSGLAATWIDGVGYVGPRETAARLPLAVSARRSEAERLPIAVRTKLAERRPLTWPDLAEPRNVFAQLAAEAGLRVTNGERMPHDLLYHAATPPLSLTERLTIAAALMALEYRIDGEAGTVTLVPAAVDAVAAAAMKPSPTMQSPPTVPRTGATGSRGSAPGVRVFTLRVQDVPLRKLVEVLRERHGLNIRVDEEAVRRAGLSLDRPTAVNVADATLEALLDQAAEPLGLQARRVGDTVEIGPRSRP